jgi:GTP-binding protein
MQELGNGRTKMEFRLPSRGLIGYRSEFMTDTRGTGIIASVFAGYGKHLGSARHRGRGVLVVLEPGETMTYSLARLQDRGVLFVGPQTPTYAGMIIGEHSRENDLVVNPNVNKKFTNVRSAGADEKIFLTPPRELTLEQALAYIEDDELIEITPESLRLRKRWLDHNIRKRMEKAAV